VSVSVSVLSLALLVFLLVLMLVFVLVVVVIVPFRHTRLDEVHIAMGSPPLRFTSSAVGLPRILGCCGSVVATAPFLFKYIAYRRSPGFMP